MLKLYLFFFNIYCNLEKVILGLKVFFFNIYLSKIKRKNKEF